MIGERAGGSPPLNGRFLFEFHEPARYTGEFEAGHLSYRVDGSNCLFNYGEAA